MRCALMTMACLAAVAGLLSAGERAESPGTELLYYDGSG